MLTVPGMALTWKAAEATVQIVHGKKKEANAWMPTCYKIERVTGLKR